MPAVVAVAVAAAAAAGAAAEVRKRLVTSCARSQQSALPPARGQARCRHQSQEMQTNAASTRNHRRPNTHIAAAPARAEPRHQENEYMPMAACFCIRPGELTASFLRTKSSCGDPRNQGWVHRRNEGLARAAHKRAADTVNIAKFGGHETDRRRRRRRSRRRRRRRCSHHRRRRRRRRCWGSGTRARCGPPRWHIARTAPSNMTRARD